MHVSAGSLIDSAQQKGGNPTFLSVFFTLGPEKKQTPQGEGFPFSDSSVRPVSPVKHPMGRV
jgi:hypothetical protein